MTNRERFKKVMNFDSNIDRGLVLEWAGWWDKTVQCWEDEGLRKNLDGNEIFNEFSLDKHTQFWISPKADSCPREKSHGSGIMETEDDYIKLKEHLFPKDAVQKIINKIEKTKPLYESGESIVWYTLDGFFWFPRILFGIENHLFSFYDHPDLYHRICNDLVEWQISVIDELASHFKADFMTFAEDMSYNNGPMLSESLFNEFIKPYYEKIIPEIKKHGTKVLVDSDGDIFKALPWFINSGVEGILPLERQSGVDINKIREAYPDFLMIGGFDKMVMFKSEEEIKSEFERILPVIKSGGYIPSMDHQTPPGTPIDNYRYYSKLLKEYSKFSCKG